MTRILVTGGTSFLMAPLVRRLLADPANAVRVLTRDVNGGRRLRGTPDALLTSGDVRDPHAVARAAYGAEMVIHAAFAPVSAPPREIMDTAVSGMASVLRACELHQVRSLALVSSPWAEDRYPPGDLAGCYGAGKLAQELMAASWQQSSALERVVTARVFNAYGPDMGANHVIPQFALRMLRLFRECPDGDVPDFAVRGSGEDVRSFCYIDDCADQLFTLFDPAAGPGTGCWDVGTGDDPRTVVDIAAEIAGVLGRKVNVVPEQPGAEAAPPRLARPRGPLAVMPRIGFRQGLHRTVRWYREHEEEFSG